MLGPNTASRQIKKPADLSTLRDARSLFHVFTDLFSFKWLEFSSFPLSASYSVETSIRTVNKRIGISMHMQTYGEAWILWLLRYVDSYYVNLKEFWSTYFTQKNHLTRIFAT